MKLTASRIRIICVTIALLTVQCATLPAVFSGNTNRQQQGQNMDNQQPGDQPQPENQVPNNQQPNNQVPNNQQPDDQQPFQPQPNNQQPDDQQPNDQQPFQPQPNNQQPNNRQPITGGPYELTGAWDAQTSTQYGVVYFELILEHTGTFSQQVVLGDLLTYDVGTFEVGDGWVHFNVEKHQPTTYKGKDMTWPNSFTYFFSFIDADTINFEDHIAGTSWTAYRK